MSQSSDLSNQSTPTHKLDTPDFLAFSDSQPSEFCPSNSSSPQKYWKHTPRNHYSNNRGNRRFSGNYRNNSYNSPENPQSRSFGGPYENYQNKRFGSPNHSFSNSRSSFNSSFDNSRSRNSHHFHSPKNKSNATVNISSYLHPSFMEDPWATLENKIKQQEDSFAEPEILEDLSSRPGNTITAEA